MKNKLTAGFADFFLHVIQKCFLWIVSNCFGLIAYMALAPISWPTQTAEGPISTGSDAISWGFTELPILALFFLVNLAWLIAILWKRDRQAGIAWMVVAIAWMGLLALDIRVFR